ncbi:hypothetical protein [Kineococcus sp. R86509]|uniref:hypothetical protein n=1 Tax=Kineococcus sp. R86509 TaxID=3093851 RepID=UPI0036D2EFC9
MTENIDSLTGDNTTHTYRVPTVAEALPALRQIVETKSDVDVPGGLPVDLLTASAIVGVYDQVSQRHKDRMDAMDLLTGQTFAFKVHEFARARARGDR